MFSRNCHSLCYFKKGIQGVLFVHYLIGVHFTCILYVTIVETVHDASELRISFMTKIYGM